jgi:hypothetical protein
MLWYEVPNTGLEAGMLVYLCRTGLSCLSLGCNAVQLEPHRQAGRQAVMRGCVRKTKRGLKATGLCS